MARRSRRIGTGSITSYTIKAGTRWRYQLWVPIDPEHPDHGDRQTGKAGYLTADAADDGLTDAKNQLKNNIKFVRKTPTVATYAESWLAGLQLEASTIVGYKRIVNNHISPYLGKIALNKLTATRIAAHYKQLLESGRKDAGHLGEPLSKNTVNKVHICLGAMLDAAIDDSYISVNPARKKKIVKAPTGSQVAAQTPEIITWTAGELAAFLAWDRGVHQDELHTLWLTIAMTGMRRSEALALQWRDIDIKGRKVSVRRALDTTERDKLKSTKTRRARPVDIDDKTVAALKAWRVQRGKVSLELTQANGYVFGNLAGGTRSPNEISRRWRFRVEKARQALGVDALPVVTLKGLRHTHATLLLESGINPKIVQERLGHSTISTTMNVYSHVTPTMQRAAVDSLSALFG